MRGILIAAVVILLSAGIWHSLTYSPTAPATRANTSIATNADANHYLVEHGTLMLRAFDQLGTTCVNGRVAEFDPSLYPSRRTSVAQAIVARLPSPDAFYTICPDLLDRSLYYVLVLTYPPAKTVSADVVRASREAFPKTFGRYESDDAYSDYQLFVYADHLDVVSQGTRKLQLAAYELRAISHVVWGSSLASCILTPGDYSRTGEVSLNCGGGDGGCFQSEFVRFGIVTSSVQHDGVCSNTCDLDDAAASKVECKD